MYRKLTCIGLICFFCFMIVNSVPSVYSTAVDSEETAMLQTLINRATPGSTVTFPTGSYAEILVIDKPLTLIGHATGTTVNPTSASNSFAIHVRSGDVIVKDLTVINHGTGLYTTGIKISVDGTQVINCRFVDTPIGIAVWASDVTIEDCTFIRCDDEGIALLGSELAACENTRIVSCAFYENCDGIEGQYTINTVIDQCRFVNSTHAGIDFIGTYNAGVTVQYCTIEDAAVFDLYFANSEDISLYDCVYDADKLRLHNSEEITVSSTVAVVESTSQINEQLVNRLYTFIEQLWQLIAARFPVLAQFLATLIQ